MKHGSVRCLKNVWECDVFCLVADSGCRKRILQISLSALVKKLMKISKNHKLPNLLDAGAQSLMDTHMHLPKVSGILSHFSAELLPAS